MPPGNDDKAEREVKRLRPHPLKLTYDSPPVPKHWNRGSAVETHLLNALDLLFPFAEHFFVDVAKAALPMVQDPALVAQVKGFIAQEVHHAHQHTRTFEVLEQQGISATAIAKRCERLFHRFIEPALSLRQKLAFVAALEHFTATISEFAFTSEFISDADPRMKELFLWHAAEEIEHKCVAYDLLLAVDRSYMLRVMGMLLAFPLLLAFWYATALVLLAEDRPFRPLGAARQWWRAFRGGRVPLGAMTRAVGDYLRPSFHPAEHDNFHRVEAFFAGKRTRVASS